MGGDAAPEAQPTVRASQRARKAPSKYDNSEPTAADLYKHPSTDPIDASNWGIDFLKRQQDEPWFNHFDFVDVHVEAAANKKIFWTQSHR
jgi:hypothetical protein